MNVSLYFNNFNNALNTIKNAFHSLSSQQQKIMSIFTILFASASAIGVAYRYCFKAKQQNHNPLVHVAPQTMAEVFKKHHYDPSKLPVLDMTPFGGSTDYIQYIKPKHMTSPVMQFKDAWGRNGIALHIQGKETSTREWSLGYLAEDPVSKINGVWTFHQRHATHPDFWVAGEDTLIQRVIDERHNETDHVGRKYVECPHCPIIGAGLMSTSLLENLLTGNDPDLQLGATPNFNLFA